MKTKYILLILTAWLTASCSLQEDTEGFSTPGDFYKTKTQCQSAVNSCYIPLKNLYTYKMMIATEGVTEQDTKVAGLAHEAGKASIIVVNKWDLIEKDGKTMDKMREEVRNGLAFMTYAPILFISAKTGQRVDRLFELIDYVSNQASTRITTGMLNSVLADAQTRVQPPSDKGRRLKIYYMTQVGIRPPHFVVFCNDSRLFHFSYQRYLENCLRNTFGLEGTPITLSIRQRGEKEG